ncbi:MAG: cytochrome c-type biogenesis protein CcmE [Chloroflexi bacterium ADurb.Bin325]|nr:MAG: cytochrome c-type biogenesis protein CcmE [Chloroflexi bacterium ADurb.Bin325]
MAESSTILRGAVTTSKANNRVKFIIGGVVIVALIAYLIVSSISNAGAYYREVGEVLAQQATLVDKNLRVNGDIITESITYDAATLDLNFKIADPADPGKQLAIHFHGVQPDQITREGTSAIIEGTLGPNGVVEANNLLLKCPSRYEENYDEIKVEAIK